MSKKLRMINSCLDSIEFASEYGDKEEVDKYIEISRWLIDKDEKDDLFSEADKMLEEWNYNKINENEDYIQYDNFFTKLTMCHFEKIVYIRDIEERQEVFLTKEEITALYLKMKELRWFD